MENNGKSRLAFLEKFKILNTTENDNWGYDD
jgi:hypothetical protein